MAVAVPPETVNEIVVLALRLPEVPVIVTEEVPAVAEALAVKVTTLELVVGFVPKAAVTPAGNPEAAKVTLPLNPSMLVTEIVSVLLAPGATVRLDDEDASVKLGVCPTTTVPVLLFDTAGFSGVSVPFEERYS